MNWIVVILLSSLLGLGGSSGGDGAEAAAEPVPSSTVPPPWVTQRVEHLFIERHPYPACGVPAVGGAPTVTDELPDGWACLRDAAAGHRGAELFSPRALGRDDALQRYFRVTPRGRLEVYTETRRSTGGIRVWRFTECPLPDGPLHAGCP